MADSKKKKKSNVNSNKSANKKSTTKKTSTGKKSNVSKKTTPKKSTKKATTKKKPDTKKSVKVETKKATAKKSTTKKTTTKKSSTAKKNVKVETKKATVKKASTKKVTPKSTTKKTTPKKTTKKKISTTSVKVSSEQMDALNNVLEDKKITLKPKRESSKNKVKVEDLKPIKKVANSKKAKTKFKDGEQEKSIQIIDDAFKENEKEEIIAREVSDSEKPIILESYDIDNEENTSINVILFRLAFFIVILILAIFSIMTLTAKYMTNSNDIDISYYESSDVSYNLCSGDNCSGELFETNESIDKANVSFKYDVHFDEKANYKTTYFINYKFEIYDDTKTYYSNTTQVDSKKINDKKDSLLIDVDTDINLNDYRNKLKKYNDENKTKCSASITAILKVSGVGSDKEVASLYIPLGTGQVDRTIISSNMGDALFSNGKKGRWSGTYVVLIIICFVIVIIASVGIMMILNSNYDHFDDE